jgi:hypothetical protein
MDVRMHRLRRSSRFAAVLRGLSLLTAQLFGGSLGALNAWADEMAPVPCTSTMLSSDVTIAAATYVHNGHRYPISAWLPAVQVGPNSAWYVPEGDLNPVSLDGSVKWMGASLLVACYEVPMLGIVGLHVPYFIVLREGGREVPTSLACGGPGPTTFADYDPEDPYGSDDPDRCGSENSGGDGGTWPGPGGSTCHSEYIYIETSDDGGKTWDVWWEGYATVCE